MRSEGIYRECGGGGSVGGGESGERAGWRGEGREELASGGRGNDKLEEREGREERRGEEGEFERLGLRRERET